MSTIEADLNAFAKIRAALAAVHEGSGSPDSGAPRDLWVIIGGIEYRIEVSRSGRQQDGDKAPKH